MIYGNKGQLNKKGKDIKLLVICSEISHTKILHHVATSQLNCEEIQIAGFRKTRDNKARNLRTGSSKNINKSELK